MRIGLLLAAIAVAAAGCQKESEKDQPAAAPLQNPSAPEAATVLSNRPERRVFRDWSVTCDNGAACVAFAPSVQADAGWLRLGLAAESRAAPEVLIGLRPMGQAGVSADAPLVLTIDGRAFTTERLADADIPIGRVAGPDAAAVVRALAAGERAVVSVAGEAAPLSLAGAAATMVWIDERQGRLDTQGALVRVGDQPALTRAPALPQLLAAQPADQTGFGGDDPVLPPAIEALPAVQQCRQETAWNTYVQKAVFSARLGPNQELWAAPCFAGAYNLGFKVFVTGPRGQSPAPVAFPTASGAPTETVVNAEYDPETRVLSAFNKGRGIGDCGIVQSWVWSGRAFVLREEREMRDCGGVPADLWPTLWRTR
jgi:hypothetical protein